MLEQELHYDVVVIGAGLGGLLAAAQFAERGQRVAVVERLAHVGGRFTGKTFHGAQVSTGAVHMLPFGSNGIVAAMLRELRVPHRVHDAEVFASFHVRGRQIRTRSVLAVARVLGPRQYARFVQLGAQMMLRQPHPHERDLTFAQWLVLQGVTPATHPELVLFFERISHFALSIDLDQVGYAEICETMKNMFRYGPPGIVEGGCAAVAAALEKRLCDAGVTLLLNHDVRGILTTNGKATGVAAHDKAIGATRTLCASLIVSDIGPAATESLLRNGDELPLAVSTGEKERGSSEAHWAVQDHAPTGTGSPLHSPEWGAGSRMVRSQSGAGVRGGATGLKTHVLLANSFIDHKGILYCLDTQRIAGIVQPSNSDRRLAPPGKHLLITHQLWRPERESIAEARALALADLEYLLGPRDAGRWELLTMSQYHDEWPVNRAVQGADVIPQTDVRDLYLVGDAVKPSGYLMVEGVAQSVNTLLDAVDRALPAGDATPASHIAPRPPKRRALAWLIAPPKPYRERRRGARQQGISYPPIRRNQKLPAP
jgi:phytoene dehydrogenase-like protein